MDGSIDKQKKSHLHLTEVKIFTWKVDKVDKVNKVELLLQKFICFRFSLRGYLFFFFFFLGGEIFSYVLGTSTGAIFFFFFFEGDEIFSYLVGSNLLCDDTAHQYLEQSPSLEQCSRKHLPARHVSFLS